MLKINFQKGAFEISTITAIIIIAAIVAAVSVIATIKYCEMLFEIQTVDITAPKLTPSAIPTPVIDAETANWQTYRNDKYGFELKYPINLYITSESETKNIIDLSEYESNSLGREYPGIRIQIDNFSDDFKKYIDNWADENLKGSNDIFYCNLSATDITKKEIKIDGTSGVKFKGFCGNVDSYVFFTKDGKLFSVTNSYQDDKLFSPVLSTFKFTEKNETNDSFQDNLIISFPFHNSNRILQVYGSESSSDICKSADEPYCITNGLSIYDTTLSLNVYNARDKSSVFVGKIQMHSGGNAGGLFVPYAITKDDSKIILEAYMGDPGAGGGMVNYGYAMIPIVPLAPNADPVIIGQDTNIVSYPYEFSDTRSASTPSIAPSSANFYDLFGKVVYVDEGDQAPHYPMPGPSNNGVIIFRNLVSGEVKKLLEEKDTSYEIIEVDEKNKVLKFKSMKYIFSESCLREEDALYCADKSAAIERSMILP